MIRSDFIDQFPHIIQTTQQQMARLEALAQDLPEPKRSQILETLTELAANHSALQETSQLFISLVEVSPTPVLLVQNGICVFINTAGAAILGLKNPQEIAGEPILKYVAPDYQKMALRRLQNVMQGLPNSPQTIKLLCPDGSTVFVESAAFPIEVAGQSAALVIAQNITERRATEEALQSSQELYRRLLEASPSAITVTDIHGAITFASDKVTETYGEDRPEDLYGQNILDWMAPEEHERARSAIQKTLTAHTRPKPNTYTLLKKDGTQFLGELSSAALRNTAGTPIGLISITRDITEEVRAQEALRHSEAILRATQELAKIGGWELDVETHTITWTPEAYRIHELPMDYQPTLENAITFYPPGSRARIEQAINRAIQTGEPWDMELQLITAQGRWRWVRVLGEAHAREGKIVSLSGFGQDITERKTAELALRESEERFRAIFESVRERIAVWDREHHFIYANQAALDYLKLPHDAIIGKKIRDVLADLPDMVTVWNDRINRVFAMGTPLHVTDATLIRGHLIHSESTLSPIKHSNGEIFAVAVVYRDVTRRKQSERDLIESEERYRTLVENFPNGMVALFDHDLRFTLVGGSDLVRSGKPSEELKGKTISEVFPQSNETMFRATLAGESTVSEMAHESHHYKVITVPIRDAENRVTAGMIMTQDITDRVRAEESRLALAVEKERVKILTAFIQDASHEFSAPLSIMNTNIYLLSRSAGVPAQVRQLDSLKQQTRHIDALVKAMLTMARLDSGIDVHRVRFDLNQVLRDIHTRVDTPAADRAITTQFEIGPDSLDIEGDPQDMHTALLNLIENALKYTPNGGTITVQAEHRINHTILTIADTGIGIDQRDLPRVFERFYRADAARTARGAGLGMSIAKKIIEQHQGEIEIASEPGKGTTLTIQLPLV